MYSHVVGELGLLLDLLAANFACELRFLVGCHVNLHSPRILFFPANLAIDLWVGSVLLQFVSEKQRKSETGNTHTPFVMVGM